MKDEIQSYHWRNQQVSIFTAVCYRGDETVSFAVVSDDTKHDSTHALLAMKRIIEALEENAKPVEKLTIISDGAASQFKNRYQLHELKNSTINKKWLYSVTGHGKDACDGVGGIIKHLASLHNLKSDHIDCINDAMSFVHHVKKYTTAINLLLLSKEDLAAFRETKTKEWKNVKAVKGIQKCHVWNVEVSEQLENQCYISRTAKHPGVKV